VTRKLPEYEALMVRSALTGSSDTAQVIPKTVPHVIRRQGVRGQERLTRYFSLGDGMLEAAVSGSKERTRRSSFTRPAIAGLIGVY